MFKHLGLLILAILLVSAASDAQAGALEIQGYAGLYSPAALAVEEMVPGAGTVTAEHADALALGGRLDIWLKNQLALELGGMYTSTSLDGQVLGITGSTGARAVFGSAKLLLQGASDPNQTRFHIGAGIMLGSMSYDDIDGSNWVALTVGGGVRVPLSEFVALRLDVDDYIYTLQWFVDGVSVTDELLQHDLVFSLGLSRYLP